MRNFSDEIRLGFPALRDLFQRCEDAQAEYHARFRPSLRLPSDTLVNAVARNAPHFLLASLCRVSALTETVIHSVNGHLPHGMYLAIRAHVETAGSVAHLVRHLRLLYAGEVSRPDFEATLAKICLGTRREPDVSAAARQLGTDVTAISVLTLLGSAAKCMAELTGEEQAANLISDGYEYLSEYCHPNRAGRRFGVEYAPGLTGVNYRIEQSLREDELRDTLNYLYGSHLIFIASFDSAFQLLRQHETLPLVE